MDKSPKCYAFKSLLKDFEIGYYDVNYINNQDTVSVRSPLSHHLSFMAFPSEGLSTVIVDYFRNISLPAWRTILALDITDNNSEIGTLNVKNQFK